MTKMTMKESFESFLALADNAYFENQEEYEEKAKDAQELIKKFVNYKLKEPYSGVIAYNGGINLTDQYLDALKKIDPDLRSVRIIMKGSINRTVDKDF